MEMNQDNAFAQDRGQGRSMVISQSGIVATESPLASQAGAAILERGGNAVDAAIAAHAVMTVVAPMWNGIGGDLFAIVYDAKSGKYYGLNASGWAPAAQSIERLRQKGLREMPVHGIESATVPGAVDGWQKLLDRFGKKKLNEVLAPAIQIAEDGFPVTEWIALHFATNVDLLRDNEAAAQTFLISRPRAAPRRSLSQSRSGLVAAADRAGRPRRFLPRRNYQAPAGAIRAARRHVHREGFLRLFERMGRAHLHDVSRLDGLRVAAERAGHRRARNAQYHGAVRPAPARAQFGARAAHPDRSEEAGLRRRAPLHRRSENVEAAGERNALESSTPPSAPS